MSILLMTDLVFKQDVEFELSIHDMFRRQRASPDGDWTWRVDQGIPATPFDSRTTVFPQISTRSLTRNLGMEGWDASAMCQPSSYRLNPPSSSIGHLPPQSASSPAPDTTSPESDGFTDLEDLDPPTRRRSLDCAVYRSLSWIPPDHDLRFLLEDGIHPSHSGCPSVLTCLEDGHGEPTYTVPVMVRCAILSAEERKLSTHQICEILKAKYPYFRAPDAERKLNVRSVSRLDS